jgi:hypothetical protein
MLRKREWGSTAAVADRSDAPGCPGFIYAQVYYLIIITSLFIVRIHGIKFGLRRVSWTSACPEPGTRSLGGACPKPFHRSARLLHILNGPPQPLCSVATLASDTQIMRESTLSSRREMTADSSSACSLMHGQHLCHPRAPALLR